MKSMKSRYPVFTVVVVAVIFSMLSPQLAKAATFCDSARFITDVTIPDGSTFKPGEAFTKTWRLGNNGSCTWTTGYALVYVSGDRLGSIDTVSLPVAVPPGQSIDLSVNMTAPAVAGHYRSSWKLKNAGGALFGLGSSANQAFWADINVIQADTAIYDLTTNAGYAQWLSGVGALTYPAVSGDYRGYAMPVNTPQLEDGSVDALPGLLTVPQNKFDGYIQATYPEVQLQAGDHFQTLAGCEYGATSCFVTFRLDVLAPAGRKTVWSWKEKYDGRYYRANIDLSAFAGQKVKIILMLLGSGDASGDRAIWGEPRIIRGSGVMAPLPTFTPTLTPFAPPPTVTLNDCDKASLVSDVTIPYGSPFSAGVGFTKTWRVKNIGSCTWSTAYSLIFYSGEQMGAPTSVPMPREVVPGDTVDLSVNMVAPPEPGNYRGFWALRDPSGTLFGTFVQGPMPLLVEIEVAGTPANQDGYDFAANFCSARWIAGSLSIPCPGTDRDPRGAVLKLDAPKLEDGSIDSVPGLLTLPQNKTDGYIQGIYPAINIQPGDRFDAKIGCEYGATSCFVTFRLDYLTPGGTDRIFWTWKERYEGQYYHANVDLSPLAGQSLRLVLTVLASGSASGDRAIWAAPHLIRGVPGTPGPTTAPPSLVTSPSIRRLFMIDASNGWALGASNLLRTTDGGVSWYNVTMPGVLMNAGTTSCFFPNANTGWVLVNTSDPGTSGLYHTVNGGASWVRLATPFSDGYVQFLDAKNGFVLSGQGIGMNKQPVSLYQTKDGGVTWVRNYGQDPNMPENGLPVSGHKNGMVFRDTTHGWINGNIPMDGYFYLFATSNAGANWVQQQLPMPAGFEGDFVDTGTPHFFTSSDAVLPAWIDSKSSNFERDLFIYVTHNGGASWTLSSGFAGPGKNTDFVSTRDGFTWDWAGVFHVTNDSGNSWNTVTPNVNFADTVGDMDFVSTSTGWMLEWVPSGNTVLYRSVDGGHTWTQLYGPPPATPTSTSLPDTPTPTATPAAGSGPVTGVSVSASAPAVCTPGNQVLITGAISASAPAMVTYHWEIGGDTVQGVSPDTPLNISAAGTTNLNFPYYPYQPSCGNYTIKLVVSSPNAVSGMAAFSLFPPTATAGPTPDVTATPTGTLPTNTPEASATSAGVGPYAVWTVRSWQTLQLFASPSTQSTYIDALAPSSTNVMLTGNTATGNGAALWLEVQRPAGGTGWTIPNALTEYVTRDAFCADTRVPALLDQLKQALNNSDGASLAGLVNGHHGLDVRLLSAMPAMNFTPATAANVFQDSNNYVWLNDQTGIQLQGTFAAIVQPRLLSVFNDPGVQSACDDNSRMYPDSTFWSEFYNGTHFYAVYKPGTPGVDANYDAWLAGFDYVNHIPYLSSLTQFSSQP